MITSHEPHDIYETGRRGKYVLVHCRFWPPKGNLGLRIPSHVYLKDPATEKFSRLVRADNVLFFREYMPDYREYLPSKRRYTASCTLMFEPLPPECLIFDLRETFIYPGILQYLGIERNDKDIYTLDFE